MLTWSSGRTGLAQMGHSGGHGGLWRHGCGVSGTRRVCSAAGAECSVLGVPCMRGARTWRSRQMRFMMVVIPTSGRLGSTSEKHIILPIHGISGSSGASDTTCEYMLGGTCACTVIRLLPAYSPSIWHRGPHPHCPCGGTCRLMAVWVVWVVWVDAELGRACR